MIIYYYSAYTYTETRALGIPLTKCHGDINCKNYKIKQKYVHINDVNKNCFTCKFPDMRSPISKHRKYTYCSKSPQKLISSTALHVKCYEYGTNST